jgi:DNA primase
VISPEIIAEVKRRADIIDVIGEYVTLKPAGKNYKGLCPFHNEKTPSFSVSPDGVFYCFGCKASGSTITFIEKYLNLTFIEAIHFLADKYGIRIDETTDNAVETIENTLLKIYAATQEYYSAALFRQIGQDALDYFTNRKLADTIITQFGLGYSPDSFDHLYKDLRTHGFSNEALLAAGVIREKNGKYYDFFRNRAMFPIKDFLGRTIAFGGRQLVQDKNSGKYINSQDSKIYDKKQTLFGLFEAKGEIRKSNAAIIVEGYLDMLSMYQAGYKNIVAPCGTALSKEQLQALKKHTNASILYFMFDGDTAGINAAERGIEPALELGYDLRIVVLPKDKDPDSIINDAGGAEEMEELIDHYLTFPEFITRQRTLTGKFTSPAEKSAAMQEIFRYITLVPDKLQHKFYVDIVKEIFGIDDITARNAYKQALGRTALHIDAVEEYITAEVFEERPERLLPEERTILHYAFNSTKYFDSLLEHSITADDFVGNLAKDIFELRSEYSIDEIMDMGISDAIKTTVSELVNAPITNDEPDWGKFADVEIESNMKALVDVPIAKLRLCKIAKEIEIYQPLLDTDDENIKQRYRELNAERTKLAMLTVN